ncbi:MAG: hypothetical protein IJS81_02285 [Selenomonadaceae bacterium]|nr:hypothetical protein [Selenomonadaceae bacterium]
MAKKIFSCIVCGKRPLSKNEVGINKKLLGMKSKNFYCIECLANFLEVEPQDILDKIEDFKNDGCKLFE